MVLTAAVDRAGAPAFAAGVSDQSDRWNHLYTMPEHRTDAA